MYVRPQHRENRVPVLHQAIETIRFGTLITVGPRGPIATHIPMFVNPQPQPNGRIFGHIARQNRQWQDTLTDRLALATFVGPHAYISPSLYETTTVSGKVVPTWMYLAVEVSGPLEFFDGAERLHALVRESTLRQERDRAQPWSVEDAPEEYVQGQLRAIVGFELVVQDIAGAWKFAQKKSEGDRSGVVDRLAQEAPELVELVRRNP
jgi:transcriptional regulator